MRVLDTTFVHVIENLVRRQRAVQTAVAVGCFGQLVLLIHEDSSLEVQRGQDVLFEENDILRIETEVAVGLEELLGLLLRVFTRHNVPEQP